MARTTEDDDNDPLHPRNRFTLRGHAAAESRLLEAVQSGRLPHAWLISGPRGIGKATLAYRFARFVLSGAGKQDDGLFGDALPPVDSLAIPADHPVAQRISARGHADLRVLEPGMPHPDTGKPTQQIVVSQVRKAIRFTNMTSAEGGWRIILVDPADDLNPNAQNALLKSLEEPPPMALFLLTCNAPGRLLPTIRSRCAQLFLEPLEDSVVLELLEEYEPDLSVPDLSAEDRSALATLAEGSIGDAIALAEAGGLDLYGRMVRLMGTLDRPDILGIHALGDSVGRRGGATDSFITLRDLIGRWLARLIVSAAQATPQAEVIADESRIRERLLSLAPLEQWLEVWEKVTRLLEQADSANLDRKQAVVNAFLTIAAILDGGQARAR
jgi:DNA polymerase-3 subunit delta'